jgi:hypothetical protein
MPLFPPWALRENMPQLRHRHVRPIAIQQVGGMVPPSPVAFSAEKIRTIGNGNSPNVQAPFAILFASRSHDGRIISPAHLRTRTADHDTIPPGKVVAFDCLTSPSQGRYFNGLLSRDVARCGQQAADMLHPPRLPRICCQATPVQFRRDPPLRHPLPCQPHHLGQHGRAERRNFG